MFSLRFFSSLFDLFINNFTQVFGGIVSDSCNTYLSIAFPVLHSVGGARPPHVQDQCNQLQGQKTKWSLFDYS